MPSPERGEIWLVRFPFTDLTTTKLRPALVLAVHGEDVIVMGVFSRIPDATLRKTWLLLDDSHAEFASTGLKKTSLLKAEKIAVVHESVLQNRLGIMPADIMERIATALKKALHIRP
ncbi:type II toxin-antitoxin system PemK/MazF family toxin [Desulfoferrobacter suflitae]|uniref:type II toxin-antitoxin system PemK/MazF family toxin n=1 Tax=Desulfoferrobacter suflitae TaxID=2865782 RepID=UPI00216412AD|nr:type II toxin-antitoxin system PemK/MazF family toxin [Desulfoferrobacter suflitae]MCK8603318.1 type II toxin-antitoxin system PemK/MazF family toxin [Desulfoferrobacter suflitae]